MLGKSMKLIRKIAKEELIYLKKLDSDLKKKYLRNSSRGPAGGYNLEIHLLPLIKDESIVVTFGKVLGYKSTSKIWPKVKVSWYTTAPEPGESIEYGAILEIELNRILDYKIIDRKLGAKIRKMIRSTDGSMVSLGEALLNNYRKVRVRKYGYGKEA